VALVHTESAGNTAVFHAALHILDQQHAGGAHKNAGAAAGTPERINFDSHEISFLAQAGLFESVDQCLHLLFQIPREHFSLVDPLWEKYLNNLCRGASQTDHR
jgi:hypothetical protein